MVIWSLLMADCILLQCRFSTCPHLLCPASLKSYSKSLLMLLKITFVLYLLSSNWPPSVSRFRFRSEGSDWGAKLRWALMLALPVIWGCDLGRLQWAVGLLSPLLTNSRYSYNLWKWQLLAITLVICSIYIYTQYIINLHYIISSTCWIWCPVWGINNAA